MKSHIATEEEYSKVEQAYWDLADPALLCAPNFTAPSMSAVISGKFTAILCEDDGKVVGVMCVKNEDHGIYYPVMKGNYAAVLASLCECAQDNFDSLSARTDNQYIHELAAASGRPYTYDGNTLVWSK